MIWQMNRHNSCCFCVMPDVHSVEKLCLTFQHSASRLKKPELESSLYTWAENLKKPTNSLINMAYRICLVFQIRKVGCTGNSALILADSRNCLVCESGFADSSQAS